MDIENDKDEGLSWYGRLTQPKNRLFIAFLALIVWIPLPFASNHPWAWFLMLVAIYSFTLVWLYQWWQGEVNLTTTFRKLIPLLTIWGLWLFYICFQLIPLPISWVAWLSPQAAELHSLVEHSPIFATLSVDTYATTVGLFKSIGYFLLFCLTLVLVYRRTRLKWLAFALVFSGLFQAVYGSFMTLSGVEYGFFHEKAHYIGVATGTFINRNHLANYLVICLSIGIGLIISQLRDTAMDSLKDVARNFFTWVLSEKMQLRMYLVFMVIALVMTHSRMGNTSFFIALFVAGAAGLILSRRAPRATVTLLASLVVIDIFIVGAWFGVDKVAQRLEKTVVENESRVEINKYTIPYWQDYFVTGSGLGSYYSVFPRYQGNDLVGYIDHAHNDYLQFAAETGLIGIMLLWTIVVLTLNATVKTLYQRRTSLFRGMAFASFMSIVALIIHSSVEFNFQIPANATAFILILAIGWLAHYMPRKVSISEAKPEKAPVIKQLQLRIRIALLATVVVLVGLTYYSAKWALADMIASQTTDTLNDWQTQSETITLEDWDPVFKYQEIALGLDPHNPELMETMGRIYFWKALKVSILVHERKEALEQALDHFVEALKYRPASGVTWSSILLVKHYLQQHDAQFDFALEQSILRAGARNEVRYVVAAVGLDYWFNLNETQQNQVSAIIDAGIQYQRGEMRKLISQLRKELFVCARFPQYRKELGFCPKN